MRNMDVNGYSPYTPNVRLRSVIIFHGQNFRCCIVGGEFMGFLEFVFVFVQADRAAEPE
jgi:hypothetical protein